MGNGCSNVQEEDEYYYRRPRTPHYRPMTPEYPRRQPVFVERRMPPTMIRYPGPPMTAGYRPRMHGMYDGMDYYDEGMTRGRYSYNMYAR